MIRALKDRQHFRAWIEGLLDRIGSRDAPLQQAEIAALGLYQWNVGGFHPAGTRHHQCGERIVMNQRAHGVDAVFPEDGRAINGNCPGSL